MIDTLYKVTKLTDELTALNMSKIKLIDNNDEGSKENVSRSISDGIIIITKALNSMGQALEILNQKVKSEGRTPLYHHLSIRFLETHYALQKIHNCLISQQRDHRLIAGTLCAEKEILADNPATEALELIQEYDRYNKTRLSKMPETRAEHYAAFEQLKKIYGPRLLEEFNKRFADSSFIVEDYERFTYFIQELWKESGNKRLLGTTKLF